MKKIYITIITLAFVSVFGLYDTVFAASSASFSPSGISKNTNDVFDISFLVNPTGNKVCAIEGDLAIRNLSIMNIALSGNVIAQTAPSATNHKFLLGIPGCTTADSLIFTITARAGSAGTASVSLNSLDIIGEGNTLGSAHTDATYTIIAVAPIIKTPTIKTPAIQTSTITSTTTMISTATSTQGAAVADAVTMSLTTINMIWALVAIILALGGYWVGRSRDKK